MSSAERRDQVVQHSNSDSGAQAVDNGKGDVPILSCGCWSSELLRFRRREVSRKRTSEYSTVDPALR